MTFRADKGLRPPFLEELVRAFGAENVLTDVEDLYVYSFYGELSIRRRCTPSAVLRLHSESEENELVRLAAQEGARIIRNDRPIEEGWATEGGSPVLLVDAREPFFGASLRARLSELEKLKAEMGKVLKVAPSFLHWFVSSLRTKDGYLVREGADCDDGYCAVQPFFDGVETWSSKGRLLLTRGLFRGELIATKKLIDSIYTCTACGQCYDQVSLTGLEMNNAIIRARHEIARRAMEPTSCKVLLENIKKQDNPMGMPSEDRSLWFEDFIDEFTFRGNEVLYWAGCQPSYRLPHTVESTVDVLRKAEVDFGMLGDREGCCGLVLYLVGLLDEARENAFKILDRVRESGTKALVTGCAGCYYVFTRVYPEHFKVRLPLNVCHTSQLIESLIDKGRLKMRELKMKVIWHDPCDLGRHCSVYEAPRKVLKNIPGLKLEEIPLNRRHSRCCGAGGGLWLYNNNLAEKIAQSKLSEDVLPMDAEAVVTGCPTCNINLKYAAQSLGREIKIYDLAELVDRCL